jgi:hypothetical protein
LVLSKNRIGRQLLQLSVWLLLIGPIKKLARSSWPAGGSSSRPCFATLSLGLSALAGVSTQVSGPVAHDNLAVYFVHGSAVEGAVPVTLEEALAPRGA